VSGVTAAGIDFVEIGYRNFPPGYNSKDVGLTGRTSDDYVKSIRQAAPTAKLAVMYYAGAVTSADLEALASLGVAMVRCDIPVNQLGPALPLIKKARDLGMISVANITVNTDYADEDLVNDCNQVINSGSNAVYLADSNGSMTPESVRARFELVMSTRVQPQPPMGWGFHNHNNVGLAMANAIEAMQMGVAYIDASMRGMGRAAGNVPTESLTRYIAAQKPGLSLLSVLQIAEYLAANVANADPTPTLQEMALGAYDFSLYVEPFITLAAAAYRVDWYSIIAKMATMNLDKPSITQELVDSVARSLVIT
jgi:4-hydroxy 2-oxovalerate aldolase